LHPPFQWWNGFNGASASTDVCVSVELNGISRFTENLIMLVSLCQETENRDEDEDFKIM
jgi:hypothetical protein